MSKYALTGAILAGGMNRRFNGRKKAFIKINGNTILDRIGNVFQDLFEEILLVTNEPEAYPAWPFSIVSDRLPIRCSLTGIHAALYSAHFQYVFITACDTPFLNRRLVETIIDPVVFNTSADVIVPETSAGLEPLCALYSKRSIATIEQALAQKKCKVQNVLKQVSHKKIPESVLKKADPQLLSFFNINTPEDLEIIAAHNNFPRN
jgi:molybdopterin-guanine dinucleotide biosynthesis protein A